MTRAARSRSRDRQACWPVGSIWRTAGARRSWRRPRAQREPPDTSGWSPLPSRSTWEWDGGVGPLGPPTVRIAADRDTVFDILAAPYLGRQTRALAEKIQILERGSDMVLAAHRTPGAPRLTATTVETVRFTRPGAGRLLPGSRPGSRGRGALHADGGGNGHGARLRRPPRHRPVGDRSAWGDVVAAPWERSVASTFAAVKAEAERRTGRH